MPGECLIRFEEEATAFYAGEELRGQVVLNLTKPFLLAHIVLNVGGESQCFWTNRVSEKVFSSKQVHLEESLLLPPGRKPVLLRGGVHKIPFKLPLDEDLPSSIAGDFGHTDYLCGVVVQLIEPPPNDSVVMPVKDVKTLTADARFFLTASLPVSNNPTLQRPFEIRDAEYFSRFCCLADNGIQVAVRTAKVGYVVGEKIPVIVRVTNRSTKKIEKILVKVVQTVCFVGQSQFLEMEDRKEVRYLISKIEKAGVRINAARQFLETLEITDPVLPTQVGYSINIEYNIELDCHPGPSVEIPLILGTS